ncbi:hypothetical protein OKW39_004479 [Paraburkholderia sp. MM6662-R1]
MQLRPTTFNPIIRKTMDSTTNTPALDLTAGLTDKQLALHPICGACGWRKGVSTLGAAALASAATAHRRFVIYSRRNDR